CINMKRLCIAICNVPATTESYTLSLHDALPICAGLLRRARHSPCPLVSGAGPVQGLHRPAQVQPLPVAAHHGDRPHWQARRGARSEEHTSELQSRENLVCRLLLEKKKNKPTDPP